MSISAISSPVTTANQSNAAQSDFRQQFKQLTDALQSGDLSDARQAYADLLQTPGSAQGSSSANSQSPLGQALAQIGQALQNSDVSGAQQALQSLQQAHGGHHHGGHHKEAASSAISSSTSTTSSSSSGTVATNVDIIV